MSITKEDIRRVSAAFPAFLCESDDDCFRIEGGVMAGLNIWTDYDHDLDATNKAVAEAKFMHLLDEVAESLGYRLHPGPVWYPEGVRSWRWYAYGITDARLDIRGSYDSKLDALCSIGELSKKRQVTANADDQD